MSLVEGVVVVGDRRGRELGYPTANVETQSELPEDGVYAGRFERADGSVYVSAISIGRRPTYYVDGVRLLEAHLLEFDDDLYGERVRVEVGPRVRPQLRFESSEELVSQMARDVAEVRRLAGAGRVSSGELDQQAG